MGEVEEEEAKKGMRKEEEKMGKERRGVAE